MKYCKYKINHHLLLNLRKEILIHLFLVQDINLKFKILLMKKTKMKKY